MASRRPNKSWGFLWMSQCWGYEETLIVRGGGDEINEDVTNDSYSKTGETRVEELGVGELGNVKAFQTRFNIIN